MENEDILIMEALRELIAASCEFQIVPSKDFQKFHKEFLKFAFIAREVEIDYQQNQITVWGTKPHNFGERQLLDWNQSVTDQFSYTDLEETLFGCIKNDHLHLLFYRKLLAEYGEWPSNGNDMLSA